MWYKVDRLRNGFAGYTQFGADAILRMKKEASMRQSERGDYKSKRVERSPASSRESA